MGVFNKKPPPEEKRNNSSEAELTFRSVADYVVPKTSSPLSELGTERAPVPGGDRHLATPLFGANSTWRRTSGPGTPRSHLTVNGCWESQVRNLDNLDNKVYKIESTPGLTPPKWVKNLPLIFFLSRNRHYVDSDRQEESGSAAHYKPFVSNHRNPRRRKSTTHVICVGWFTQRLIFASCCPL